MILNKYFYCTYLSHTQNTRLFIVLYITFMHCKIHGLGCICMSLKTQWYGMLTLTLTVSALYAVIYTSFLYYCLVHATLKLLSVFTRVRFTDMVCTFTCVKFLNMQMSSVILINEEYDFQDTGNALNTKEKLRKIFLRNWR